MAGKPKNFQVISNVLANYNFVDIASGTGYINFYAGKTVDLNLLSNNTFYSDSYVFSGNSGTSSAWAKVLDYDYDVLLNRPLDLQGLSIVNVPIMVTASGALNSNNAYVIIKLRKWDGATETDICNNQSSTTTAVASDVYKMTATDLTVPITHYKKGEYLRLTIELWGMTTDNNTHAVSFASDPMNRTTGWDGTAVVPSRLLFQCPVRLNL